MAICQVTRAHLLLPCCCSSVLHAGKDRTRRKANAEWCNSGLILIIPVLGNFRWDDHRSRLADLCPLFLRNVSPSWLCARAGALVWGVQTSHPEPHLTLGGLWVLRDGSSHLLWGKAGTAAAGVAEPEDNPWHFGDI